MASNQWRRIDRYSLYDLSSPCGVRDSDSPSGTFFSRLGRDTSRQRVSSPSCVSRPPNISFRTAWATVIHMSDEGDGMKLHDLARGSSNPASFMPAFHLFRSRSGNQETATLRSRKSHESVPIALHFTISHNSTAIDHGPCFWDFLSSWPFWLPYYLSCSGASW